MDWILYINYAILIYAILYIGFKTISALYSMIKLNSYSKKENFYWDYHDNPPTDLLNDYKKSVYIPHLGNDAPSISIVASAFNESANIVSCTKSFMNQDYPNFEVIIVNDGSTDGTLDILKKEFGVKKTRSKPVLDIPCEKIRGIYKNGNLIVVDKENGGMADGQNAGINLSKKDLVFITDGDCLMEKDALKRTVMPFIEKEDTVGVGGVIQMINDCEVSDGNINKRVLPKSFLPKLQVLEYLKSYLISRMGWQDAKTLLVASGAYGLYDRTILEEIGGCKKGMLADDIYITTRINEYLYQKKRKGKIRFIPDTCIWTEAPEKLSDYGSQRMRWGTGIMQAMWEFKNIFMNPKYKILGLFTYPYNVFFVWLTPIVEMFTLFYGALLIIMGYGFEPFLPFIVLVYLFGVVFNLSTVFLFNKYGTYNSKDKNKLIVYSLIEPLFYHWINSFYCVIGYFKFLFGKTDHMKMDRKGIEDKNNKDL